MSQRRPGDWECPSCSSTNFARRNECFKCKEPNPDGGGNSNFARGGQGSGGGFGGGNDKKFSRNGQMMPGGSSKDWTCKSCFNVNYERRERCNLCNQPKEGPEGSREGFGGGFFERDLDEETRDKRRLGDSDDEYDEFGRIKKKRNKFDPLPPQRQARLVQPVVEHDYQQSIQRREDSDDEQVGKWDAWDDVIDISPRKPMARSTHSVRPRASQPPYGSPSSHQRTRMSISSSSSSNYGRDRREMSPPRRSGLRYQSPSYSPPPARRGSPKKSRSETYSF